MNKLFYAFLVGFCVLTCRLEGTFFIDQQSSIIDDNDLTFSTKEYKILAILRNRGTYYMHTKGVDSLGDKDLLEPELILVKNEKDKKITYKELKEAYDNLIVRLKTDSDSIDFEGITSYVCISPVTNRITWGDHKKINFNQNQNIEDIVQKTKENEEYKPKNADIYTSLEEFELFATKKNGKVELKYIDRGNHKKFYKGYLNKAPSSNEIKKNIVEAIRKNIVDFNKGEEAKSLQTELTNKGVELENTQSELSKLKKGAKSLQTKLTNKGVELKNTQNKLSKFKKGAILFFILFLIESFYLLYDKVLKEKPRGYSEEEEV